MVMSMHDSPRSDDAAQPHDDPAKIDTLGKLADVGMGLTWTCNHCHRPLRLTLDEAIRRKRNK